MPIAVLINVVLNLGARASIAIFSASGQSRRANALIITD
jgi:hypothetical protein